MNKTAKGKEIRKKLLKILAKNGFKIEADTDLRNFKLRRESWLKTLKTVEEDFGLTIPDGCLEKETLGFGVADENRRPLDQLDDLVNLIIEKSLTDIFLDVCHERHHENFMKSGLAFQLDNVAPLGLIAYADIVEDYFGVEIEPMEMENCQVLSDLVGLINKKLILANKN